MRRKMPEGWTLGKQTRWLLGEHFLPQVGPSIASRVAHCVSQGVQPTSVCHRDGRHRPNVHPQSLHLRFCHPLCEGRHLVHRRE